MRSIVRRMVVAGALAFGLDAGIGAIPARGQAAVPRGARPLSVAGSTGYAGGAYRGGYYYGGPYRDGYYYGGPGRDNAGSFGPGPARDWSTGRDVRLAKPWMQPLPR